MPLTETLAVWLKVVAVLAAAAGGAASAAAVYSIDASHSARLAGAIVAGVLGALFAATPWLVVAVALSLLARIETNTNHG